MAPDPLRRLPVEAETRDLLARLAQEQGGLLARRQLTRLGVPRGAVRAQLDAGRWSLTTPRVVQLSTGEATTRQREWVGVLHAGPRSMLGGLSALRLHGLAGWEPDQVTVWVDDELAFEPVPGVRFFRSRRPFELLRGPGLLPRARCEPAALVHAGYRLGPRAADGLLAAVVQQRLTTPERLLTWVQTLRPLRGAPRFRAALGWVAAGSHSRLEQDVVDLCAGAGLEPPRQQHGRTDADGRRRWTDCEWLLPDGRVLVLEVDGGAHVEARHWAADERRARRLSSAGRLVVGCTAYEVRHEPAEVIADLVRLGVPRARSCA
ncbi:endonuclease domain-containing protein [Nocardioides bruguierae]|uniref:endonuclease domain-containing protein n=1 Tax=Nocardioides bruguierae TaxID=2945102 RepID=UPI002020C01D|nr:endonuclease domain-containing protein [Nocardioides bruguierae]MCL8027235.1 endonuclease domain-containing protein [Nocardioides bruguierae]